MKVGNLRKLSTLLAAVTLAFSLQVAAPVAAAAQDNAAVAINQKDGSSLFKFAFDVRRVMNGVVDQSKRCADRRAGRAAEGGPRDSARPGRQRR